MTFCISKEPPLILSLPISKADAIPKMWVNISWSGPHYPILIHPYHSLHWSYCKYIWHLVPSAQDQGPKSNLITWLLYWEQRSRRRESPLNQSLFSVLCSIPICSPKVWFFPFLYNPLLFPHSCPIPNYFWHSVLASMSHLKVTLTPLLTIIPYSVTLLFLPSHLFHSQ